MLKFLKKIKYFILSQTHMGLFLYRAAIRNFQLNPGRNDGKSILLSNITSSPSKPGFNQLVLWLLGVKYRLEGHKVYYLYCNSALDLCPQGASYRNPFRKPPCKACRATRSILFSPFIKIPILIGNKGKSTPELHPEVKKLEFIHTLRHFFKRFHLEGVEEVSVISDKFRSSAADLLTGLKRISASVKFDEVIVFNGVFYPEQAIRNFYQELGVKVLSFEVGFTKLSFFLTEGLAPEYDFKYQKRDLSELESYQLDQYLNIRFKGQFEMGFTKFWKQIDSLGELGEKFKKYRKVVTIFTNSVYDTSTVFSNSAFDNLFDWLKATLDELKKTPDILVVIRSHPDEFKDVPWEKNRIRKTQETIKEWLEINGYLNMDNLCLIGPTDYLSSYELIQHSNFVIVYNSTVGLEALLMGKQLVLGGKPKYFRISHLRVPTSPNEYLVDLKAKINQEMNILAPAAVNEARCFFYQLFFTSGATLNKYIDLLDISIGGSVILNNKIDLQQLTLDQDILKFYEK